MTSASTISPDVVRQQLPAHRKPEPFGLDVAQRVSKDLLVLLAGGRVLLLTMANERVAESMARDDHAVDDPWRRFIGTTQSMYTLMFGTDTEVDQLGAHLRRVHENISGPGWRATDDDLYWYNLAALHDTGVVAYERFVRPLTASELEAHYAVTVDRALRLGINKDVIPPNHAEFSRSMLSLYASLSVTDTARRLSPRVLAVEDSGVIRPFLWLWRLNAVWLLPNSIREQYGLSLSRSQLAALETMSRWSRMAHKVIPDAVWSVGYTGLSGTDFLYASSEERKHLVTSWALALRVLRRYIGSALPGARPRRPPTPDQHPPLSQTEGEQ